MTTRTDRAIEEILLQTVAHTSPKLRATTRERAAAAIARIRLVSLRIAPHQRLALLISTRTLAARALQSATTALARLLPLVLGTVRTRAITCLLGIAGALGRAADGGAGCELAALAAVLVGVVADGVVFEFACAGVATRVVAALVGAAAVTVFAIFYDAVAAYGVADGRDAAVVGETSGCDRVALQRGTYVSYGTR